MDPLDRMRKKQRELHGPTRRAEQSGDEGVTHTPALEVNVTMPDKPQGPMTVKPQQPKKKPRPKDNVTYRQQQMDQRGRLPDGATFHMTYNAETQRWAGSLVIPGCPTFQDDSSGLFKLNRKLDTQFRRWEEGQKVVDSGAAEG